MKAFTLKVHLLSFCKHLLTAGTAGTRGVVVLLPSLGESYRNVRGTVKKPEPSSKSFHL